MMCCKPSLETRKRQRHITHKNVKKSPCDEEEKDEIKEWGENHEKEKDDDDDDGINGKNAWTRMQHTEMEEEK